MHVYIGGSGQVRKITPEVHPTWQKKMINAPNPLTQHPYPFNPWVTEQASGLRGGGGLAGFFVPICLTYVPPKTTMSKDYLVFLKHCSPPFIERYMCTG